MAQGLDRKEYEVLVYDGGSTDQTQTILKNHPLNPVWISGLDGGQANAVNLGMREARGAIIAWINSDDYYLPDAINTIIQHFENAPKTRIIYGNAIRVDTNGDKIMDYPIEDWNYRRLLEKCYLCQPATFFRKEILQDHGFLNENFHLALDLEFWLRIGKYEDFLRVHDSFAAAREYSTNKSQSYPLRMQIEALWAGYIHTGKLSAKRLWSISENLVFIQDPQLKKSLDANPKSPWKNGLFWTSKILRFAIIKLRIQQKEFPWHWLDFGNPIHEMEI